MKYYTVCNLVFVVIFCAKTERLKSLSHKLYIKDGQSHALVCKLLLRGFPNFIFFIYLLLLFCFWFVWGRGGCTWGDHIWTTEWTAVMELSANAKCHRKLAWTVWIRDKQKDVCWKVLIYRLLRVPHGRPHFSWNNYIKNAVKGLEAQQTSTSYTHLFWYLTVNQSGHSPKNANLN